MSDYKLNTDAAGDSKCDISKVNEELVHLVDGMNNRMRRNNLVIKGLDEVENEDYAVSERIVGEFFTKRR